MIGNIDFHVKGMSGKKTLAKYKKQPKIRIIIKNLSYFYKDVNKKIVMNDFLVKKISHCNPSTKTGKPLSVIWVSNEEFLFVASKIRCPELTDNETYCSDQYSILHLIQAITTHILWK